MAGTLAALPVLLAAHSHPALVASLPVLVAALSAQVKAYHVLLATLPVQVLSLPAPVFALRLSSVSVVTRLSLFPNWTALVAGHHGSTQ